MAKGPVHSQWSRYTLVAGSILTTVCTPILQLPWIVIPSAIAGLLMGLIADPDLDQAQTTQSEKRVFEAVGPIVGSLWLAYWKPYAWSLKHRSPFSHLPVLATTIRFLYASVPFILIRLLSAPSERLPFLDYVAWVVWPWGWPTFLAFLAGWTLQDTVHAFLDDALATVSWLVALAIIGGLLAWILPLL